MNGNTVSHLGGDAMADRRENHHTVRNILIGAGIGLGAGIAISKYREKRARGRDVEEYDDDDVVYDYWDR